jgi:FkbM family methyltransferase
MRGFISWLSRIGWIRRLAQALGLHKLANLALRFFPLRRRLPSGVIYRSARIESVPLAVEMFETGLTYNRDALPRGVGTFIDLGCNVGYFTILLADLAEGRPLKGLMVDANPEVIGEAEWHVRANPQLREVFPSLGLVGAAPAETEGEFYLYASNICSSREPVIGGNQNLPGQWRRVTVPCVSIQKLWEARFGKTRCNLLKVDVEGAEFDFFRHERPFLDQVDAILLEWHKWSVGLDQIKEFLAPLGFRLARIFEEDANLGTCLLDRTPPAILP